MVDTFVKLVEKIIDLVKLEKLQRDQFFNQIIEPLFKELELVVDDYLRLFLRARDLTSTKSGSDFREAVKEIRNARESLLIRRIKVRKMSEAIRESYKDKKINVFASNIHNFFFSTQVKNQKGKVSSRGERLVELCDYVTREDISRGQLMDYINSTLKNLENSWVAIAQSYATIRVYCLSSLRRGRAEA